MNYNKELIISLIYIMPFSFLTPIHFILLIFLPLQKPRKDKIYLNIGT